MNKKQLYETIMIQVSKEVRKALNESMVEDTILEIPENATATMLYDDYKIQMANIEKTINETIHQFCEQYLVCKDYEDVLKYFLTVNYDVSNLNLCDNDTHKLISPFYYDIDVTNKQLVNYGFENNMLAWFSATWNFSAVDNMLIRNFCMDILKDMKRKPGMKITKKFPQVGIAVNGIEDVHSIYVIGIHIEEAYNKMIDLYRKYAELLPAALKNVMKDPYYSESFYCDYFGRYGEKLRN